MGYDHDLMAHAATKVLLQQLQTGNASHWTNTKLTAATTYWHGMADWPRPDHAFEDRTTNTSMAIEFKPPAQSKREYVTAVGQAITYLREFEYAAIVLPMESSDGFGIANYIKDCLSEANSDVLAIALFGYEKDPGNASDLRPLVALRNTRIRHQRIPHGIGRKVFWAYWRDISQFDVLDLLNLMDYGQSKTFDKAFARFWKNKRVNGTSRTWEGRKRKPTSPFSTSYKAERLNASLSLRHIGVISSAQRITETGYELLRIGRVYGADSIAFLHRLGKYILRDGRHLDLVLWANEQQRQISSKSRLRAPEFYHKLDIALTRAGIIPIAPIDRPKPTFLRDEQKLWNKLGLLVPFKGRSYFHPREGLVFNWEKIISMTS